MHFDSRVNYILIEFQWARRCPSTRKKVRNKNPLTVYTVCTKAILIFRENIIRPKAITKWQISLSHECTFVRKFNYFRSCFVADHICVSFFMIMKQKSRKKNDRNIFIIIPRYYYSLLKNKMNYLIIAEDMQQKLKNWTNWIQLVFPLSYLILTFTYFRLTRFSFRANLTWRNLAWNLTFTVGVKSSVSSRYVCSRFSWQCIYNTRHYNIFKRNPRVSRCVITISDVSFE